MIFQKVKNDSQDARQYCRVKEDSRIKWFLNGSEKTGQAKIRNISQTGMLIETNSGFIPTDHSFFSFENEIKDKNYIPQSGRLVWFKRKKSSLNRFLCGIQFIAPAGLVSKRLNKRIEVSVKRSRLMKSLAVTAHACLLSLLTFMVLFTAFHSQDIHQKLIFSHEQLLRASDQQAILTQDYAQRYYAKEFELAGTLEELRSAQILHDESALMLNEIKEDLLATKTILAQTEEMLESSVSYNMTVIPEDELAELLKQEAIPLPLKNSDDFTNVLNLLNEKNSDLSKEVQQLKDEIAFYAGDVSDVKEAKILLAFYKDKIRFVRSRIKHFKSESAKVSDDISMELSQNKGFIFQDTKGTLATEAQTERIFSENIPSFEKASMNALNHGSLIEPLSDENQLKIDVSFYK